VSFGDVNLSEEQIRGNHNPGAGGWPTIRYFNKKTGYEGASYTQKTSDAMCTELGNEEYMQAYIEEAGETSLCSAATGEGCGDREKKFIQIFSNKSQEDVAAQLTRLQKMSDGSMKAELMQWVKQRIAILRQLKIEQKSEL